MTKMKYVGGLVTEEAKARLTEIAKREDKSVSNIIRHLVEFYIIGHENIESKEDVQ